MPNQDLLFPILPRAPAAPGMEPIKREVAQVGQPQSLRKSGTDKDDAHSDQQAHPPARSSARPDQPVCEGDGHKPSPDHRIDLFV